MNSQAKYSPEEILEIARRLRSQREKISLSQREVAEKIHQKKDVIQRLESGKLKIIDKNRLLLIAWILDCNPAYLTLASDDPRTMHSDVPPYYEAPDFKYTAESFLASHRILYADLTYAKKYMHPDFQKKLEDIIHTFVTFHKCGVHYPNTDADTASKISFKECAQFIKDNFWAEENERRKKWTLSRKNPDLDFLE